MMATWRRSNLLATGTLGLSVLTVVLAFLSTGAAENTVTHPDIFVGNMPADMSKVMTTHGCRPVKDFYNRPGIYDPPYLWDYKPDGEYESAVFWCDCGTDEEVNYVLFVLETGPNGLQVKERIDVPVGSILPGGLSAYEIFENELSSFVHVDNEKRIAGPEGTTFSRHGIFSSYDGVGLIFCEYEGDWIMMRAD